MKNTETKYTCDWCGKEVIIDDNYMCDVVLEGKPDLLKDWFSVKRLGIPHWDDLQERGKLHFCSTDCIKEYFTDDEYDGN